jgi:hypothetical protein
VHALVLGATLLQFLHTLRDVERNIDEHSVRFTLRTDVMAKTATALWLHGKQGWAIVEEEH